MQPLAGSGKKSSVAKPAAAGLPGKGVRGMAVQTPAGMKPQRTFPPPSGPTTGRPSMGALRSYRRG